MSSDDAFERRVSTVLDRLVYGTIFLSINWTVNGDGTFTFRNDGFNGAIVASKDGIEFRVHPQGGGRPVAGMNDSELTVGDEWPHQGQPDQQSSFDTLWSALETYQARRDARTQETVDELMAHLDELEARSE